MEKIKIEALCYKMIELINRNYVIASTKNKIVEGIQMKLIDGEYDYLDNSNSFASLLTEDLRELSEDKHLYVETFSENRDYSIQESEVDWLQKEKEDEIKFNYGFTEVKVLTGNIGYLKIKEFMNPDRGIETAIAAMKLIENTDTTIIDLRDNGGGYGGLAEYILSYFFDDEPTLLSTTYFKEEEIKSYQTFTHPFVVGKRRINHKLYVLINSRTGSAAEYFAYVLQANNKADIVGEPSTGAANRNSFFNLNETLRISISTGAPIIESTGTNWEGTGVIPDIRCTSNEALDMVKIQCVKK